MKNVIAVDLDGVICNTSARQHLLDESWEAYHSALGTDTLNETTNAILKGLSDSGYEILVVSGRPAKWDKASIDWLNKHNVEVDEVLLRESHDYRPEAEVKIDLMTRYFGSLQLAKDSVLVYFEIKDKTVEALRDQGFSVWSVG